MIKLLILFEVFILMGCGQVPITTNSIDNACRIIDTCTYDPITQKSKYECQALMFQPTLGDGATISYLDYAGAPCIITKQDYQIVQIDPNCSITNPTNLCGTGWGGTHPPFIPCCEMQTLQGPGPAANPSDPTEPTPNWVLQ